MTYLVVEQKTAFLVVLFDMIVPLVWISQGLWGKVQGDHTVNYADI